MNGKGFIKSGTKCQTNNGQGETLYESDNMLFEMLHKLSSIRLSMWTSWKIEQKKKHTQTLYVIYKHYVLYLPTLVLTIHLEFFIFSSDFLQCFNVELWEWILFIFYSSIWQNSLALSDKRKKKHQSCMILFLIQSFFYTHIFFCSRKVRVQLSEWDRPLNKSLNISHITLYI